MSAKRLGMLGVAVLLAGGGLVGTAVAASAATPTLSFTPNTNISLNQGVLVTASGFSHKVKGGLSQCPILAGEPTILDVTTGQQEPVGCQAFTPIKTTSGGHLPNPTGYGISSGFNGPPDSGTDSGGGDAATDAAKYPCPPTAAQVAAGGSCVLVFTDQATPSESAQLAIAYNFESTTTTTAPAVAGCTPKSATVTTAGATLTVNPATCLVGNEPVKVTGSGLKAASLGTLLECSTKTPQATVYVSLATKAIPVSCSTLTSYLVTTGGDGSLPTTTFTIIAGQTGPPATAAGEGPAGTGTPASTDSPTQATADAANFLCNNTSPDGTCTLTFGDQAGDQVSVPLAFGSGPSLAPPASKSGSSTAKASATKAKSGSLAFTGAGPGLWIMGLVGMMLILLGGSLLVVADAPRRLLAVAWRRDGRSKAKT